MRSHFLPLLGLLALGACASTPKSPEKPAMIAATEWGSTPDTMPEAKRQTPRYLTLHHAGELWKESDVPETKLRNLQSWGKAEKKWPDVPYHFLIAPDGRIFEGRSIDFAPETNTRYDTIGHIGINAWGNFEEQRIGYEQLEAVVNTAAYLCTTYGIDPATIGGHKDVAPGQTVCPGKDYHRYIDSGIIQGWIAEKMAGREPAIEVLPPLEGGPTVFIPGGSPDKATAMQKRENKS